jgi:YfiH family protein
VRNRQSLEAALDLNTVLYLNAEHGARVQMVDGPRALLPGDACITGEPSLGLAALGADCATVALAGGSFIAVVHCGWRGVVAGVIPAALKALERVDPGPYRAVLGPHICARCYPVGIEVWEPVREVCPAAAARDHGRLVVNLRDGIVEQASPWEVRWTMVGGCTFEEEKFFSYRRDGTTGRQGLVIWRV